jgi:hypothetical protein
MMIDLLTLIENVHQHDYAELDEIDARVECFLLNVNPEAQWVTGGIPLWKRYWRECQKYSRSYDSIKGIRPQNWDFSLITDSCGSKAIFFKDDICLNSPHEKLPTEELAMLHATIQVIMYERLHKAQ